MRTERAMADLLKLQVPGKPEYVRVVRMAAAAFANNFGFDIEAVEDIKLAVGEACNNVVQHCEVSEDMTYEVHLEKADDALAITVKDCGQGYDTGCYKEPDLDNLSPEGGLGLFIIKAMMDEVEIHSEIGAGTHIRMKKKLAI
jgi:serine/threonine-protein kinase RsbW